MSDLTEPVSFAEMEIQRCRMDVALTRDILKKQIFILIILGPDVCLSAISAVQRFRKAKIMFW